MVRQGSQNINDALICLLILSRDPDYQKRLAELDVLSILVRETGLLHDSPQRSDDSIISALKCISNVIFKNPQAVQYLRLVSSLILINLKYIFRLNNCLDALLERCGVQIKSPTNLQIVKFDLKILFLCSALESASRLEILTSHFESDIFLDFLRWILAADFTVQPLMFDIAVDMLKFLFNLCYAKRERDYDLVG